MNPELTTTVPTDADQPQSGCDLRARRRIFTTFSGIRNLLGEVGQDTWNGHGLTVVDGPDKQRTILRHFAWSRPDDLFLFNGEAGLISAACLLKLALPSARGRIVAVDMVLRKPEGAVSRFKARVRRHLWRQVDLFLHYFRDLDGYERHYGIGTDRSRYVAFKSNVHTDARALAALQPGCDGDYVFSAGRSLRDYQTLVEAAALTDLPFAILFTSTADWAAHGTFLDTAQLPPNVRLIPDNGGKAGWLQGLTGARIVAIPTRPESLCASGIGTYLDAMALGKPVVITRGPGADDVLTDRQASFVPPQDPRALAETIQLLWHDADRRQELARQGHAYAMQLGDERDLLQRILDTALKFMA
jgi:glycosyltransferase involved in cell wall biosynthesis